MNAFRTAEIRKKENFVEDHVKKSVNSIFFSIMHSEKNILPIMDVTVIEVQSVPK